MVTGCRLMNHGKPMPRLYIFEKAFALHWEMIGSRQFKTDEEAVEHAKNIGADHCFEPLVEGLEMPDPTKPEQFRTVYGAGTYEELDAIRRQGRM
jgi:hypothetical protein